MYLRDKPINTLSKVALLTLFICLGLDVIGFILMKYMATENGGSVFSFILRPLFYLILTIVFFRGVLWPFVLHHIEISFANTVNSLLAVLVLIVAYYLFNEKITVNNVIGALFIIFGNVLLFYSSSKP